MKKYICLNRVECSWADEKPPREFTLPEDDENVCPNCSSSNIREAKETKSPIPTPGKLGVIAVLLVGLIGLGWLAFGSRETKNEEHTQTPQHNTVTEPGNTTRQEVNEPQKAQKKKSTTPQPVTYSPLPEVVTVIKGSEGCDVCTHYYSVNDKGGRVREVREDNSTECCPCGQKIQIEGQTFQMNCDSGKNKLEPVLE